MATTGMLFALSATMRLTIVFLAALTLAACDTGSFVLTSPETGGSGRSDAGMGGGDNPNPNPNAYHPVGFSSPDLHGLEFNLQEQDCRSCHGSELEGVAQAPSCDSCHSSPEPTAWRSDCTFCHGDSPKNLDGSLVGGFAQPHLTHLSTAITTTIECSACHNAPSDVLSLDHAFDSTPGAAEVVFAAALNPQAGFANNTCSNNYCHGNGRGNNGSVAIDAPAMSCEGCHAGPASGSAAWATMSGRHRLHLNLNGVTCADCHVDVTTNGLAITNPALHVDGIKQASSGVAGFAITQAGQVRCTGACHGDNHQNESW